jgi:hypothetical protein
MADQVLTVVQAHSYALHVAAAGMSIFCSLMTEWRTLVNKDVMES